MPRLRNMTRSARRRDRPLAPYYQPLREGQPLDLQRVTEARWLPLDKSNASCYRCFASRIPSTPRSCGRLQNSESESEQLQSWTRNPLGPARRGLRIPSVPRAQLSRASSALAQNFSDSLLRASVKIGSVLKRLARPLRKYETRSLNSINMFYLTSASYAR